MPQGGKGPVPKAGSPSLHPLPLDPQYRRRAQAKWARGARCAATSTTESGTALHDLVDQKGVGGELIRATHKDLVDQQVD